MRRPIRTRRLSIAAMVSMLAFVVVAAAATITIGEDELAVGNCPLQVGHRLIIFRHFSDARLPRSSDDMKRETLFDRRILSFAVSKYRATLGDYVLVDFYIEVPLWFPTLLLLIAPVRWLMARPANAPAFPVIIDA